ncbi:histidine phosphatase family protein [Metabacillus litoralis]|uniref:Histidine phosphatase family protein n=1 Tax=Metabacillus litoralis TaxID=152268 RepID=A0A5C6W8R1_9BACI|nr:histidine phosphatase family protein [Metabacillus litoralis]TXC92830.1 histidine phosphatase family protein [Metabacillus litoralis]
MKTYIYMVRHCDSPKEGEERTRGLTELGKKGVRSVTEILKKEKIDLIVSSPYLRATLTVQQLAEEIGQEVMIYEDLRERVFTVKETRMSDSELMPLIKKSFDDDSFSLTGAESNSECRKRAIEILQKLLITHKGHKVVISTHAVIMTLMMGYYDIKYGLDFLLNTTKPDIYRMEFENQDLLQVERLVNG